METITSRARRDLGKLYGGLYAYQGIISGNSFRARYDSAKDNGVFEMTAGGRLK